MGISIGIVALISIIVSSVVIYKWRFWLYLKYEVHPFDRDECENEDKRLMCFVSYSNSDSDWARVNYNIMATGFAVMKETLLQEHQSQKMLYSKLTVCVVMSKSFMASSV